MKEAKALKKQESFAWWEPWRGINMADPGVRKGGRDAEDERGRKDGWGWN